MLVESQKTGTLELFLEYSLPDFPNPKRQKSRDSKPRAGKSNEKWEKDGNKKPHIILKLEQ